MAWPASDVFTCCDSFEQQQRQQNGDPDCCRFISHVAILLSFLEDVVADARVSGVCEFPLKSLKTILC